MSLMSMSSVLSRFCEKMGVLNAAFSPLMTASNKKRKEGRKEGRREQVSIYHPSQDEHIVHKRILQGAARENKYVCVGGAEQRERSINKLPSTATAAAVHCIPRRGARRCCCCRIDGEIRDDVCGGDGAFCLLIAPPHQSHHVYLLQFGKPSTAEVTYV
jgi:hypothetical protein